MFEAECQDVVEKLIFLDYKVNILPVCWAKCPKRKKVVAVVYSNHIFLIVNCALKKQGTIKVIVAR